MPACVLTDFVSWFQCAETAAPLAELLVMGIFFTFFLLLKTYPLRESLPASLFIATMSAAAFYGMGVLNPLMLIAGIILTGLSAVFLNAQNSA